MAPWRVSWNLGMTAAAVLLAVGGGLMVFAPDEDRSLQTAGLGIVVLSGVVYLVARVLAFLKGRSLR